MSFSTQQARSFLAPLTGKTTTFLLEDRRANLGFARTIMGVFSQTGYGCAIIDLDAFYSSNSDGIFRPLDQSSAGATVIRVPEPGADIEKEFSALFGARQKVIIIDSLNTLYHLISLEDGSSRSRKLAFALASLSYFARTNSRAVFLTMYRREGLTRGGTGRSISSHSDATMAVNMSGQELTLMSEQGSVWADRKFSIRIPSE
jgi:hypothetical protein